MPTPTTKQSFYRTSLAEAVATTGATTFKLSGTLPTTTVGRLVISATDTSKREVIYYSSLDVSLNGVVVAQAADRGLDDTVAQIHTAGEVVQMNFTAGDYNDLVTTINAKPDNIAASNDVDNTAKAAGRLLQWNATTSKHEYVDPPTLGAAGIATQAEAEAATNNTQLMTPLRAQQARDYNLADQSTAEAGTDNTKLMTPLRVAQSIVTNAPSPVLASQAEAEAGTENTKTMTSLRTAQAIEALSNDLHYTLTAGEALTAADAVMISDGTEVVATGNTDQQLTAVAYSSSIGYTYSIKGGQTWQPTVSERLSNIKVKLKKVGSPSGIITMKIYAADKTTLLATSTDTFDSTTISTSYTAYTFSFDGTLALTASTTYFIELSKTAGYSTSNYVEIGGSNSSSYAGGDSYEYISSWVMVGSIYDIYFDITYGAPLTAGRVYRTDATTIARTGCVGFATAAATTAASVPVCVSGVQAGFTGLTPGAVQYLSDTPGAISPTPGTVSVKVARALSATEVNTLLPV